MHTIRKLISLPTLTPSERHQWGQLLDQVFIGSMLAKAL